MRTRSGRRLLAVTSPDNPSEAISREEAVTVLTRGLAYAEGTESEKGMLAPGMLADLAVLRQDVFAVSRPRSSRRRPASSPSWAEGSCTIA
ncbi:MAG TPA: amidohydrolase family protein [Longimicrobiaceae bacterium]|nr:amidohydrolase family protein [Longimicrobiaceae bacterium]